MGTSLSSHLLFILSCVYIVTAYDYVVIGGGPGGLTVASRLAEDKSVTVALIEAGPNAEHLPEVMIPGMIGKGQSFTTLNWAYSVVPQPNLNMRQFNVNAGKALGGGTIINSMIFTRAGKSQYDAWGKLNKDQSWTWDELVPYFRKSEFFTPPNPFQAANGARYMPEMRGFKGRVKTGFPNFFFPQSSLWMKASGFRPSLDTGNGEIEHEAGVSVDSLDPMTNTRCSAACAYYTPFADQENFHVIVNATVKRIVWSAQPDKGGDLRATAVEYVLNNEVVSAEVEKEVILSAGTIGTPKIMELSGVGNTTIISAAGVKPVRNIPSIGENLSDHVHSWTNAFTNATLTKDLLAQNSTFADEQLAQWYNNRTGMYSACPRTLGIAAASDIFNKQQLEDLVQAAKSSLSSFAQQFSNGNVQLAKGIEAQHDIAIQLYENDDALPLEMNLEPGYSGPTAATSRPVKKYTTINSVLYAPLSRGRTHITSSDHSVPPAVDPAYFAHPLDVAAQVGGIQLGRKMLRTPPLDSIYEGEFEPGLNRTSDADVEAWLRAVVASDNHIMGTMAMMPQELGGVVDTSLRVYGLKNVRVVDASIIPFPISAHLSSSVYMIGERAADIIKSGR